MVGKVLVGNINILLAIFKWSGLRKASRNKSNSS